MKIFVSIFVISIIIITGCVIFQHQKKYTFPTSEVTVAGDAIYCAGKPFAKLWTIDPKFYMEDTLFSTLTDSGLGLAIQYYDSSKEIWIHPEDGITVYQDGKEYTKIEDMKRVWSKMHHGVFQRNKLPSIHIGGRHMEKETAIRSVVFDVRISDDGKYVYYKVQGILWNSSCKYLVEYGASK